MLTTPPEDLARRARCLARKVGDASVVPGHSTVGGGSFPEAALPTSLVAVRPRSCDEMVAALRRHQPPIIARVEADAVVFDVRTLEDDEFAAVADAVRAARG
jgi:L-seryl-tRNA(Ser) seleniumtransferase